MPNPEDAFQEPLGERVPDDVAVVLEQVAKTVDAADKLLTEPVAVPSPRVGRIVHYVAYGTPGGEFPVGAHRAALITEISPEQDAQSGRRVGLAVMNPTGMFFNQSIPEDQTASKPGTWHWPERD